MNFLKMDWQLPADLDDRSILLALEEVFGTIGMRSIDRPHQVRAEGDPSEEERIQRCLALLKGDGLKFVGLHREMKVSYVSKNLTFFDLHARWGCKVEKFCTVLKNGEREVWRWIGGAATIPIRLLNYLDQFS